MPPVTAIDHIMQPGTDRIQQLASHSKALARLLLTVGENRIELLAMDMQEDRDRLLHVILLALGMAMFGLLAGITITASIIVLMRAFSTLTVLLTLSSLYVSIVFFFYWRLTRLVRNWQVLSASMGQFHQDRSLKESFP